jgi:hypothetical protein
MVPQATCSPARQCWLRAWQRAVDEKLVPYYVDGTHWAVKDYTVTVTGPGWSALACNCPAGRVGRVCKHCAVVAKAIALHVRPVHGTAKADARTARAKRIADDLNGGYGATEETVASVRATLQSSTLIAGVAPQIAELYA